MDVRNESVELRLLEVLALIDVLGIRLRCTISTDRVRATAYPSRASFAVPNDAGLSPLL